MAHACTVAVLSDIHYASPAEVLRKGHESRVIHNPAVRLLARCYRRFFWLNDPFAHNHQLDRFLAGSTGADFAVANGDYSCDTAFVGVSDEPAFQSASTCLAKLRGQFSDRLRATYGDHEIGKMSLVGGCGGPRLASWHRAQTGLDLKPLWRLEIGRYVLLGVVSSLLALPVYEPEALTEEIPEWRRLRAEHIAQIGAAFEAIQPNQRIILFCHDPTALPFLAAETPILKKLDQLERTIIGHLHTPLIFWKSKLLAGMPIIPFFGNSIRRMSVALHQAREWRPFRVMLCPSLAGCQLLKDGGFYTLALDLDATTPPRYDFHPLPW